MMYGTHSIEKQFGEKRIWPRCYFIYQPLQCIFACQFECVMSENFLTNTPSLQRIPGNMLNKCRYRTMAISPDLWLWNRVLFFFARWYNLGVVAIFIFLWLPIGIVFTFLPLILGRKIFKHLGWYWVALLISPILLWITFGSLCAFF